jgi:hypothetical protein
MPVVPVGEKIDITNEKHYNKLEALGLKELG